jgi:hypothetical protein
MPPDGPTSTDTRMGQRPLPRLGATRWCLCPRQLYGLSFRWDPDDPPGEPAAFECSDHPAAGVDFETSKTVER